MYKRWSLFEEGDEYINWKDMNYLFCKKRAELTALLEINAPLTHLVRLYTLRLVYIGCERLVQ